MQIVKGCDSLDNVLKSGHSKTEFTLISKLLDFLVSFPSLREMLEGSLSLIMHALNFNTGAVYLIDKSRQTLILAGSKGIESDPLVPINENYSSRAVSTGIFLIQRTFEPDEKRDFSVPANQGFGAVVCIPLIVNNETIGIMNLTSCEDIHLTPGQIELLLSAGCMVAIAAGHARLNADFKNRKKAKELIICSVSFDLRRLVRLFSRQYGELLDDEGRRYCAQITKAAEQMMTLVENSFSSAPTQKPALHVKDVHLEEILEAVKRVFAKAFDEKHIRWLEPELSPVLKVDGLIIAGILQNFIDNLLKYGGDHTSEIQVEYEEDDHFHILSVSNAQKRDPAPTNELFAAATCRGMKGIGFRLSIIREMAAMHRCIYWSETDLKKRTKYCVAIPKVL